MQPDAWRGFLPGVVRDVPGAAVYLARSLPFTDTQGTNPVGSCYFISTKGRTYQDQEHGEPWPAAAQLYQVTALPPANR